MNHCRTITRDLQCHLYKFIRVEMIRTKFEPIRVKEPFTDEVKVFDTVDSFTRYYREHESEHAGITSMKLNKMYRIPGYRIRITNKGKDNEELILVKDYTRHAESSSATPNGGAPDAVLQQLMERVAHIESYLQQLKI